ncbi:hypothetical protein RhiirC2_784759 [Rhizophagus irregularis]|uniref:Uncharacterized protein n=1 Tax=Rhizophagus irregularis TaxID=588596 RepID=A0A2N1MY20_9GLOM|nr:hypothetical protein RhiirC2_784759 [Rhizophagus irregularis]
MVFQVHLPFDVENSPEPVVELTTETPLFGINENINDILMRFQQTIDELLGFKKINGELTYKKDFDADTIKCAILSKLNPGCLGPSPDVIILEPDEAIYRRYGLLSLASRLGVRFLDKFEMTVDYRSTARVLDLIWAAVGIAISIYINNNGMTTSEIMDGDNNKNICLKIWYMYFKWAGIWKTYQMAMHIGNFDLQRNALSAATTYPKFEEKLRHCCSFKVPNENPENAVPTCFSFDKALETFRMKFIKQHVNGNVIDEKNLKDQIKGIQDERERIDLLMSKYLGDHSISSEVSPTEIHKEGLDRLIACYPDGLGRIKKVYFQEVLEVERKNTQGRGAAGVIRTKKTIIENQHINPTEPVQITIAEGSNKRRFDLNEPCPPDTTEPQLKKRRITGSRHHTTKDEMDILSTLKVYKDKLPDNAIASIREQLSDVWTIKKVQEWWYYHKDK